MFKRSEQMKQICKKLFSPAAILQPLWEKGIKSETISLYFFSPRIPKILKVLILDFGKWGCQGYSRLCCCRVLVLYTYGQFQTDYRETQWFRQDAQRRDSAGRLAEQE